MKEETNEERNTLRWKKKEGRREGGKVGRMGGTTMKGWKERSEDGLTNGCKGQAGNKEKWQGGREGRERKGGRMFYIHNMRIKGRRRGKEREGKKKACLAQEGSLVGEAGVTPQHRVNEGL